VDLELLLNAYHAAETSLVGCTIGFAADPEVSIRQAVTVWTGTNASVALKLVTQQGRFAITRIRRPGLRPGQVWPSGQAVIGAGEG
jgi:hypothetical protein